MSDEIKICCQHCGGHISFPLEYLGQTIACPHCEKQIVLTDKPTAHNETKSASSKSHSSKSMRSRLLVGFGASVLMLGVAGWYWVGQVPQTNKSEALKSATLVVKESNTTAEQGNAEAQANTVDLIAGTIDGVQLNELTVDKVTDLFGKPSKILKPTYRWKEQLGNSLCYHQMGLEFYFNNPKIDGNKEPHCAGLKIHLLETWDERSSKYYKPYSGSLSRQVSSDWKTKKVLDVFSDYKPVDIFETHRAAREANLAGGQKIHEQLIQGLSEESRKLLEKSASESAASEEKSDLTIRVELNTHRLFFDYDNTTKFIEEVDVILGGPRQIRF